MTRQKTRRAATIRWSASLSRFMWLAIRWKLRTRKRSTIFGTEVPHDLLPLARPVPLVPRHGQVNTRGGTVRVGVRGAERVGGVMAKKNVDPLAPYGRCECRDGCQCRGNPGPAAYRITRGKKRMIVCTRCTLRMRGDKDFKLLLGAKTNMKPFWDYDALGTFCLVGDAAE